MSELAYHHVVKDMEHNLRVQITVCNEDETDIQLTLTPCGHDWGIHSSIFLTADAAREVAQSLLAAVEKMEYEPGDRPACQILGGPHHQDDGRGMCRYCGEPI